jgi:hypothetical protein
MTSPFPPAPNGYVACRTMRRNATLTHLVRLDEKGSNGGRPTACGLTRFDDWVDGKRIPGTAGLGGWGMGNSGISGPNVGQLVCEDCYADAERNPGPLTASETPKFEVSVTVSYSVSIAADSAADAEREAISRVLVKLGHDADVDAYADV